MNDEGSELLNKVLNNLDGGGGGGGGAGSDNASLGGGGVGSISNSQHTEEGEEGSMDVINNALKQAGGGGGNTSIEADTKAEQILEDLIQRQQAKKSLMQKMIDEATDPIILSILFIIFQSAPVQNLLTTLLGRVFATTKYSVMAVQALLFALVYYILKKLLA